MTLLTDRECDIIKLINKGLSNKLIAQKLGISVHTVKVHVSNIFRKSGLNERSQLSVFAQKINY